MSAGAILTLGFGTFGSVNLLPTLGYGDSTPAPVDDFTVTPGWQHYRRAAKHRYEEMRRREATIESAETPAIVEKRIDEYAKESERVSLAIQAARNEAQTYRNRIAELEALESERRSEIIRRKILLEQQALRKAEIQAAVLQEEMEVLDVAFFAVMAMSLR